MRSLRRRKKRAAELPAEEPDRKSTQVDEGHADADIKIPRAVWQAPTSESEPQIIGGAQENIPENVEMTEVQWSSLEMMGGKEGFRPEVENWIAAC